nr:MAG: ORF1 [TTV-like mini virus]
MPFYNYYRRNYWRQRWRPQTRWRRRHFRRRRPTKTIRRRWPLRRKRYRVRRKFYRLFRKKKLKYLYMKQFQPKKIRKCKVKGTMCIFQCGPRRLCREWTTFINSYYPEHNEGGGGWSIVKFSLESLFEQKELLRNKWTASNVLMPLVRYCGCKLKFYRTHDVDYICNYSLCLPMKDTIYQHTNAQPNNMLLYKQKVIVPSKKTAPYRKNFIVKKLKPPDQFKNQWYFQQDMNKQPLLLLTSTACSLNRMFLNPTSVNSNITLNVLNTDIFKTPNFQNIPQGTGPWQPKPGYFLYATHNGDTDPQLKSLIFLGQTKAFTEGKAIGLQTWQQYSDNNKINENMGNIFHTDYFTGTKQVFISQTSPVKAFQNNADTERSKKASTQQIAPLTQPLYITLRYTPERDKGDTNEIYLLRTTDTKFNFDEPDNELLIYSGFPLWCLFWGFIDWQTKIKEITNPTENAILVLKTEETYPTKKNTPLILLDDTFIHGYSPWQWETHDLYDSDARAWHPKVKYQEMQIEKICETGPATCKTSKFSIEAHIGYCFYFKWGGCPNDLEHIKDPGEQEKYPTPNYELQGPEIQDPNAEYKYELWPFDFRRQMLTKKAKDRISQDQPITPITFTGSKLSATPQRKTTKIQALLQTPTQEEEDQTQEQQQQLQQLKHQQHKLKQQLYRLIQHTPNIKF